MRKKLYLSQSLLNNYSAIYFSGEYAGFDENELTSRGGGKGDVVRLLIKKFGYSNLVMIGDGATDAEAAPPAQAFIGTLFSIILYYLGLLFILSKCT